MGRVLDIWGKWDGETYECHHCSSGFDEDDDEGLSVYDAALIWASNGKDENYTFGYSEDELEDAM
jgi:hypothetical protein